jgi:hypothetical protein
MSDRELRDALEKSQMRERATQADLQHALQTALDLQTRLENADRLIAELRIRADESVELRRVLAAAMTAKLAPVTDNWPRPGVWSAVMVACLLTFLGLLWLRH